MSALTTRLELSIRAVKLGVDVKTNRVFPPIPMRDMDWAAIDANSYDGAPDSHGICTIVGYGRDEESAIVDLLDQIDEYRLDHEIDECDPMELTDDATDFSQGLSP